MEPSHAITARSLRFDSRHRGGDAYAFQELCRAAAGGQRHRECGGRCGHADGGRTGQDAPAGPRQVEIKAERDGHFYVDAEINMRPVRLMVDTGATVVALRMSDAQAAGLRPRQADFINPVQTANGTTMAAETMLDSIVVEDVEVRDIRALVIPDDQLSISLLGGSFLNGLERFEVADGTLIFEN
jgi:aspartyl protease family protein